MDFQDLLNRLSNPAKRALLHEGIDSLQKLAALTRQEFLDLHGIGPKSLAPALESLATVGLSFNGD